MGELARRFAVDADRLRAELPSASSPNAQPIVTHAADVLDKVQSCMEKKPSLWKRWTGEGSSEAWLELREAEAELAGTLPDEVALCLVARRTGRRPFLTSAMTMILRCREATMPLLRKVRQRLFFCGSARVTAVLRTSSSSCCGVRYPGRL